jgi:hypothetical protein
MGDHVFLLELELVKKAEDHKLNIAMIHLEWLLNQHNTNDNHDHIDHRTSYLPTKKI